MSEHESKKKPAHPGKQEYIRQFLAIFLLAVYNIGKAHPGKHEYLPMFGKVESQEPKLSMAAVMIVTKSGTP